MLTVFFAAAGERYLTGLPLVATGRWVRFKPELTRGGSSGDASLVGASLAEPGLVSVGAAELTLEGATLFTAGFWSGCFEAGLLGRILVAGWGFLTTDLPIGLAPDLEWFLVTGLVTGLTTGVGARRATGFKFFLAIGLDADLETVLDAVLETVLDADLETVLDGCFALGAGLS